MPTVESSIIASLVNSYYEYVKRKGYKFKVGLNFGAGDIVIGEPCTPDGSPGCVDATIENSATTGKVTAKWTANVIPSSSYNLTILSLATEPKGYYSELIQISGLSKQLIGGTKYTITLNEEITYNTSI